MDDHIVIHSLVKHPVSVVLYEAETQAIPRNNADLPPAEMGKPVIFKKIPVSESHRGQHLWATIKVNPAQRTEVVIDQVLVMAGQRIKIIQKFDGIEVEVT